MSPVVSIGVHRGGAGEVTRLDTGAADTGQSTNDAGAIMASPATATSTGNVINVKVRNGDVVAGNRRVAIYSDSAGAPDALLAESASTAISGASSWQTINLISSAAVTNGVAYWIAYQVDDATAATRRQTAGGSKFKVQAYGAFPNPFGAPMSTGATWLLKGAG